MESIPLANMSRLLPEIQSLPKEEKLFILQFLVSELAQQEGSLVFANARYPVWSPYQAYDAAAVLFRLLNDPERPA
jgi:hypothetical protein